MLKVQRTIHLRLTIFMPQNILDDNKLSANQPQEINSISLEDAKKLGDEYGDLMIASTLSEEEEARMDEILSLAIIHENVDFWVAQAACDRGAEVGLLSPEYLKLYEDQRTILREQLELDVPLEPVAEATLREQIRLHKTHITEEIFKGIKSDLAQNPSLRN
jgi:hypothetical protein